MPKATEHPNTVPAPTLALSRRRLFGTVATLAVAGTVTSAASARPDAELIALCGGHASRIADFNACPLDDNESPFWAPYEASRDAIGDARPTTLAGLVAMARAAEAEATLPSGGTEWEDGMASRWASNIAVALLSGEIVA